MPKISSIIINGINVSDSCSDLRVAELIFAEYGSASKLTKPVMARYIAHYGQRRFSRIYMLLMDMYLDKIDYSLSGDKETKKQVAPSVTASVSVRKATGSVPNKAKVVPSKKRSKRISPLLLHEPIVNRVITKNIDPEDSIPPVNVSLRVLRRDTFGGTPCYVVEYGPQGVEPYEWHVPIINEEYRDLETIPCVYHKHVLSFNKEDASLNVMSPQNESHVRKATPRVKVSGSGGSKSVPRPSQVYRKTPEQWHGEVASLGKHKCGKPFICSCCGGSFAKNQGYRIDFKEIYFCFECKKKIFKPSHKGWRGSVISIPMGNKR